MAKPDFAHPPRERTAGIGGGAENIAWNLFNVAPADPLYGLLLASSVEMFSFLTANA